MNMHSISDDEAKRIEASAMNLDVLLALYNDHRKSAGLNQVQLGKRLGIMDAGSRKSGDGAGYRIDYKARWVAEMLNWTGGTRVHAGLGFFDRFLDGFRMKGQRVLNTGVERDHVYLAEDFRRFSKSRMDRSIATVWEGLGIFEEGVFYNFTPTEPYVITDQMEEAEEPTNRDERMEFLIEGFRIVRKDGEVSVMASATLCGIGLAVGDALMEELGMAVSEEGISMLVGVTFSEGFKFAGHGVVMTELQPRILAFGASTLKEDTWLISRDDEGRVEAYLHLLSKKVIAECLHALDLGAYFEYRRDEVVTEPTRKGTVRAVSGDGGAERRERQNRQDKRFRKVSAIRYVRLQDDDAPSDAADGSTRKRAEPEHAVDVSGFYRRIKETSWGADRFGRPILGKTWVASHLRYKNRPRKDGPTIFVKEPIGA